VNAAVNERLCIVTPAHSAGHAGGAEYQIDRFIDVLESMRRFEIFYLSNVEAPADTALPYHMVRVGNTAGAPRFGYATQALPLYRELREIRPTAIYQRVACGYTGICAYYARQHGARLVWHVAHDSDVIPDNSLDGRNPIRRYLEKRSVEYGIRRATRIVAQTTDQARLLERNYHRKADAIIPNFHPLPAESIVKSGPLTVAWIASVKPWKRPEAFLDLADALRDLAGVQFVMVGPLAGGSDNPWARALEQRIAATPNVSFFGGRSQTEVNALLARTHVFVNTSQQEGFPNTFIQAWMREAAVVSLHVNPDQLLSSAGMGVFCDNSEARLAAAVRELLTDATARTTLTARGRKYAVARHSLENAHDLAQLVAGGTS
jgi:glycosyltransferase involved in cell wall biosynthesis